MSSAGTKKKMCLICGVFPVTLNDYCRGCCNELGKDEAARLAKKIKDGNKCAKCGDVANAEYCHKCRIRAEDEKQKPFCKFCWTELESGDVCATCERMGRRSGDQSLKKCKFCGKPFYGNTRKIYCSHDCCRKFIDKNKRRL